MIKRGTVSVSVTGGWVVVIVCVLEGIFVEIFVKISIQSEAAIGNVRLLLARCSVV
jgi:hypothetical protein